MCLDFRWAVRLGEWRPSNHTPSSPADATTIVGRARSKQVTRRLRSSRAPRSDQEADRGAQNRQIRFGGEKERGAGGTGGCAQERKAHSIQGKRRASAKVLRQARAAHAGTGFEPATCGLKGNSGAAEHYPQKQDPANCGVLPFSAPDGGGSGPIHARLLIVGRASFG